MVFDEVDKRHDEYGLQCVSYFDLQDRYCLLNGHISLAKTRHTIFLCCTHDSSRMVKCSRRKYYCHILAHAVWK